MTLYMCMYQEYSHHFNYLADFFQPTHEMQSFSLVHFLVQIYIKNTGKGAAAVRRWPAWWPGRDSLIKQYFNPLTWVDRF